MMWVLIILLQSCINGVIMDSVIPIFWLLLYTCVSDA